MSTLQKTETNTAALTVNEKVNIKTIDAANDTFDSLFGLQSTSKVLTFPKERVTKREKEVLKVISDCDLLVAKNKAYENDYIARGNQALYEILQGIYVMALHLDQSDFKYDIIAKMRDVLKSKDIKVQINTPELTVLVKYVVGSDRKRATNYSRILKVALEENLPANELASYISRRGGIGQIHETEAKSVAREVGAKTTKERLALMKEYLRLSQWESGIEFQYDKPIIQHNPDNQTKSETSSFCFFMADYDEKNNVYRVIGAHDFGKSYEDNILRFIIKGASNDINVIKQGINRYKQKLIDSDKIPESLRIGLKSDLSKAA
jgi:hypothetical protein